MWWVIFQFLNYKVGKFEIKNQNLILLQISHDVTPGCRPPDPHCIGVTSRYELTQTLNNFRFSTNMPSRCILSGCSNTNREGFTPRQRPKHPKFARNRTRFIRNTRVWIEPRKCSLLCSEHFPENCYETIEMARSCGWLSATTERRCHPHNEA